jgi:3',5'-cyclic AMP phosphodiesterase CpdA
MPKGKRYINVIHRVLAAVLCISLAVSAAIAVPASGFAASIYTVKDVTLQPGSDESQMNFCWYSNTADEACTVQLAAKAEMTGEAFPSSAASYIGTVTTASKGYYSNKVTVTGLMPQTEYVYRVGNGSEYSGQYSFQTGDSESYHAVFLSDAQIGASGSTTKDAAGWKNTLSAALDKVPDASFILSAGDQVDYYLESEYDAFLAPTQLRSIPVAPTVGNHENLSSSPLHSYHYFEPNESASYGVTPAGGDYWFTYGNTLYMVLNTSITAAAGHDAFIGQAVAANPNAAWKILMFHKSIYSSAEYSTASSTIALRNGLYPVVDKYDIDLVFSGHDHCYTRTHQMLGGAAQKEQTFDLQGRVVNPTGTVYITAGSSSGSKYYDLKSTPEPYAAVRLQLETPTFSDIEITAGSLTIVTYRADTMEAIDRYTIIKQNSSGFTDVPDDAWFRPAVSFIAEKNITTGTGSNTFSPYSILTRGQFIVLLMKAYEIVPEAGAADNFSDAGNTYYTDYLAAAKHLGIAAGVGNNSYMPEGNITRQDMFTLLYNTLGMLGKLPPDANGPAIGSFTDADKIADYAKEAISYLTASGIVSGDGGKIDPTGISTRAQMAQVLYKLLSA